jgi:hypothetical protein
MPGQFAAVHESVRGPFATEIHVAWHIGDQGKSGLDVLKMGFVARDP